MTVKAPFRFARINRWVHEPAWGHLANHDVPFADGVSGNAAITLKTITPTLVGDDPTEATTKKAGAVRPFKVGGEYAIPASSMQGMCRTILEIAGFGRLGPRIDNRKFGKRDLTDTEKTKSSKVAHTYSTHDLLGFSSPGHTEDIATAPLDMASLIFGAAAEGNEGRGLKRRAWFGLGKSKPREPESISNLGNPVVLLNPKPSYVGIYVRQHGKNGQLEASEPYSSYTPVPGSAHQSSPELAGVKLWPASRTSPEAIPEGQLRKIAENRQVQNMLYPVAENTVFKIPLTFHNLRRVELGALLWALSFGDADALCGDPEKVRRHHRIGMGKPFGLGEIAISVDLSVDECTSAAEDYVKEFVDYMEAEYRRAANGSWSDSLQVKALLLASNPEENNSDDLKYMPLGGKKQPGTYVGEKNAQRFLKDYVEGHEVPQSKAEQSGSGVTGGEKNSTPASPAGPILYRKDDNATFSHKETGDVFRLLEDAPKGGYVRVENLMTGGKPTQVRVEDLEIE